MPSRTLSEVRTSIRTEINRGTGGLSDARIDEAVRNVIHSHRSRRYGFNVKRAGLTVGSEYVTLPDDFLEIDALRLDASSYVKPLIEVGVEFIHQEKRSPSYESEPVYFAVDQNGSTRELRFYPQPDQTFSCQITYLYDLAESSSWTDDLTLEWFDEAYLLVKYGAMAEIEATHIGDPEAQQKAMVWAGLAAKAENELRRQGRLQQHSGSIEPCI